MEQGQDETKRSLDVEQENRTESNAKNNSSQDSSTKAYKDMNDIAMDDWNSDKEEILRKKDTV